MKLLRCFLLFAACLAVNTRAERPIDPPTPKFVIVVDTSLSMVEKKEGTMEKIREIIGTGFHEQIEEGESFSVWTFNHDVEKKEFPVQVWTKGKQDLLAEVGAQFIELSTHQNSANYERLFAEIKTSFNDFTMIVLITDGEQTVTGTIMDLEMNAVFAHHRETLKKAGVPFVASYIHTVNGPRGFRMFSGTGGFQLSKFPRPKPPVATVAEAPKVAKPVVPPKVAKKGDPYGVTPAPIRQLSTSEQQFVLNLPPGATYNPIQPPPQFTPRVQTNPTPNGPSWLSKMKPPVTSSAAVAQAAPAPAQPKTITPPAVAPVTESPALVIQPEPAKTVAAPEPKKSEKSETKVAIVETNAAPVATTQQTPPPSTGGSAPIQIVQSPGVNPAWFIAGGFMAMAGVAFGFWLRTRQQSEDSLISRSLSQR